ncbi:GGDEF domain-containing protein [Oceanidesulfovibrio marinus]|uniref:diguanylate cyclase n=1 Tax=Oceanidesulfovibrio marinus TaxID=370038 RepID=A0ABX6NK66_9BACT|nr:GGDEF domain-containing protein [Oceanidesulfovibrio marinus]
MPSNGTLNTASRMSGKEESTMVAVFIHSLRSIVLQLVAPFGHLVNIISGWGVVFKIRLLLFFCVVAPVLVSLILLEAHVQDLRLLLVMSLVLSIICFEPMAKILSYLLIRKELKDIEMFCMRLKQGDYSGSFALPHETDDEHELTALKRNLNWMAHVISRRESRLHAALEGANEDRNRYESLSNIDPLTGLANRRRFETRLAELAHEAAVTRRPLSIMFIDCDKFKSINDSMGHQAGDQLLKRLAAIIRSSVREYIDLPFRYGGDEFGVVCVGMTSEQAGEAAERICDAFYTHRIGDVTLSVGVAGYVSKTRSYDPQSVTDLVQTADKAAYQAKAQGGNQVIIVRESE